MQPIMENLIFDAEQQRVYNAAWEAMMSSARHTQHAQQEHQQQLDLHHHHRPAQQQQPTAATVGHGGGDFVAPIPAVVSLQRAVPITTTTASTITAAASSMTGSTSFPAAILYRSSSAGAVLNTRGAAAVTGSLGSAAAAAAAAALHEEPPITVVTPSRGHHELYRALEQLEGLEKEEMHLQDRMVLTEQLTCLITGRPFYRDAAAALQHLQLLGQAVPRRVCQHPFRKNDIVWVCRSCQSDETCVLCHACFSQSSHEGHDVAFYHAQAGGCCDCGDPDAWDPAGFCPHHGPQASSSAEGGSDEDRLPPALVHRVRGVVPCATDWLVHTVAVHAEMGYQRAHYSQRHHQHGKKGSSSQTNTDSSSHRLGLAWQPQGYFQQPPFSGRPLSKQPPPQAAPSSAITRTESAAAAPNADEKMMDIDDHDTDDTKMQSDEGIVQDEIMVDHNDNQIGGVDDFGDLFDYSEVDEYDEDNNDDGDDDFGEAQDLVPPLDIVSASTGFGGISPRAAAAAGSPSPPRSHVFSPLAASGTGRSMSSSVMSTKTAASAVAVDWQDVARRRLHEERALALGIVGAAGHGLYLVLHADDIHSTQQVTLALREFLGTTSFYSDTLLGKVVKALRQYGQLVLWGNMEIIAEVGTTQAHLWMDGDRVASARIGAVLLERASRLTRHGMFCSILTRDELILEQRAVGIIQWLSSVAKSCDPLCKTVAECILPNRHLVPLLRADFKISARITKAWYSLLLTLLAVPTFKSHLAAAYCDTYRIVTAKYARGMGVLERSGYTLSVQFLNRVTYVIDLVQNRDLLGKLGKSLLDTLLVASTRSKGRETLGRLYPGHHVMTHRRYSPCVSDLKCVLNVKGMPRVIACRGGTFLGDWTKALALAQMMDAQSWRDWSRGHIEDESRNWVNAFNASISLGSLFDRILGWKDEDESPIPNPASPLSANLMTCIELTHHILTKGIYNWQKKEMQNYKASSFSSMIDPHKRCPEGLPFSTVAARHGTALAMRQLPVSQVTAFSFHLPLHRFVSACIRELCVRKDDETSGMAGLVRELKASMSEDHFDDLFRGLMELPILVLSRASQVRAGLWRRNGSGLMDQVLNYSEPPFCRNMRDADVLVVQFAVLGRSAKQSPFPRPSTDVGMAYLVNLMVHRLCIFEFVGLSKAPTTDLNRYIDESVSKRLYPKEANPPEANPDELSVPWSYTPARDSATSLLLLEEFLQFFVMFVSELPAVVPHDRQEQTKQAKYRLFREVLHRLAYGPKTHSELSEVTHVLSHSDNALLHDEGRILRPDDATGAALELVLKDIADRNETRSKMVPDTWVLRRSAWDSYDPGFYHMSLRNQQTAAEHRPKPTESRDAGFNWEARPYAPRPAAAHPFFKRLRRDVTSDATILGIAYRILHMHCRANNDKDLSRLRAKSAYEGKEKSETALARAVQLLTLGAYAWESSEAMASWREHGGGSVGSIFFDRTDEKPPTAREWVASALLVDPAGLLDDPWFAGEDNALVLLRRLALKGGAAGIFTAQDPAVRAGAAWLCEFASSCSSAAAAVLGSTAKVPALGSGEGETEIDRRKRIAKEKAMARMKAQAAKFASLMDVDLGGNEDEDTNTGGNVIHTPGTPTSSRNRPIRAPSFGSALSSVSSNTNGDSESTLVPPVVSLNQEIGNLELAAPPPRLLQARPRCIICNNDDDAADGRAMDRINDQEGDGDVQRRKRSKKTENALGFVGYSQPSTVLKGGGGPPPDVDSLLSPVSQFVGTHVALCGHAVHSECCESYLQTVAHREERPIGKRDEFRCPLCQRLSNCLVPFIDVGVDWIEASTSHSDESSGPRTDDEDEDRMMTDIDIGQSDEKGGVVSLHAFLSTTPWWVTRQNENVAWDGHSAFVDRCSGYSNESQMEGIVPRKPSRKMRSLKKRDLYLAWNTMMRTPRFVRRRLRPRSLNSREERAVSEGSSIEGLDASSMSTSNVEDSAGETLVWRRFIDHLSDLGYRADTKRLGDAHLHELFGEFRHYIVEKFAYNMASKGSGGEEPTDWPSCMFPAAVSESRRQEFSREKLLSKLMLTIQSFTYSCTCESFEARRFLKKTSDAMEHRRHRQDLTTESLVAKFGIRRVECDGRLVILPEPQPQEEGGSQPFQGRIGKLRYFGLATMAAAGAVAADLVQLVLPFPARTLEETDKELADPDRSPVCYPLLFGHILTHVVAAMCAACGRARARSDRLEVTWPVPFSSRGSFTFREFDPTVASAESVLRDCEGFIKLGLVARILQVLLGRLQISVCGFENPCKAIESFRVALVTLSDSDDSCNKQWWVRFCGKLLEVAVSRQTESGKESISSRTPSAEQVFDACDIALAASCSYLADAGTIIQILIPGIALRYAAAQSGAGETGTSDTSSFLIFEKLCQYLRIERLDDMLDSQLMKDIVTNWYDEACRLARSAVSHVAAVGDPRAALRGRLYRTQGYRVFDWPSAGKVDIVHGKSSGEKDSEKSNSSTGEQPQEESPLAALRVQIDTFSCPNTTTSTTEVLRAESATTLVTFSSKKSVPLIGGFSPEAFSSKAHARPRVTVIPTSYTDLYAELGALMPECEQTAVCLICGEVMNAGGRGECTKHSYKCGAGAGLFFLLQECSGLIMHKSKAAYIHSPYVDSHGETPQYRGRPLNLDLDRYEHFREVWFGHGIRQQVIAERASSRQVIVPDFY